MDPLQQAHFSHRSRQIGKQLREARVARDTAMADKMQTIQMEMMPEQMKMQSSMMKPMVFTMVFIIAIFSWMASSVESFKVGFVSLPWDPMWSFNARVLWIFPSWIATYIAMSAPLGRIIDRHIKIIRFSRHPLVISGDTIQEPLLYMLDDDKNSSSASSTVRRTQRRAGPRKTGVPSKNNPQRRSGNKHSAPPREGVTCNICKSDMISRSPKGLLRCDVCRSEWR
jgi:ribosomal protein L37AE/L43A